MAKGVAPRMSRRRMLRGTALVLGSLSGSAILAACGGSTPAAPSSGQPASGQPAAAKPTEAPAAAKPTAAAAAAKPTTAPAQPAAQPAATKPAESAAAAAKPAAGTQRVVIRDHDWIQGTPGQPNDWYDQFVAKFEQEHPDIKVEREWFPRAEMHAKQLALAATGQIGDTVRIDVAPKVAELQLKGVVHDLNSLWASDKEWQDKDQKQFWSGNIKTYTREGKVWGLPVVGHPGNLQYYINKTMIEKAGLKMPPADGNWTFEDLQTLAKGLTKSEGGRTTVYGILPGLGNVTANEYLVGLMRGFGGDVFDPDGKKCLLNTPESIAGLKIAAELYKSGSAYPWAADVEQQRQDLFIGGKLGIVTQTSFAAKSWPDLIAKSPNPFEMDVIPNPIGSTGKHATQVSSDGKSVSKDTKNPDKAWIVLSRLFTSQRHGIERFQNGLGSPGSRFDVWDSDEFRKTAPKLQNIAKVLVLPPAPEMAPWYYPANGRFAEHEPILLNEFIKVTLGQATVEDYAANVGKQIQEILDKPLV
ncbi:MAG: sugar ABC transporter substrate-binding protein [Chloroflexi bacterium]|nr:sugar ABC transporter substrate-binding protein [Chloroflexota bacterium]